MEYDKSGFQLDKDAGYSETQSALDTEIQAGGWRDLGKIAAFNTYSRKQRIFLAYQAISNNIYHLISKNLLVKVNLSEKEDFLIELKHCRMVQDILLNSLLWDQRGQLEEYMVPKEVWNLIK